MGYLNAEDRVRLLDALNRVELWARLRTVVVGDERLARWVARGLAEAEVDLLHLAREVARE